MKHLGKVFAVFLSVLVLSSMANGQALFEENFGYSVGDLTIGSGAGGNVSGGTWVPYSTIGTNIIQVVSGSLSYTSYPSSGSGNKITMINGSAEDAYQAFTTQTTGKVYASFLVNITSITGMAINSSTTGDYFAGFLPSTSVTLLDCRVSVKVGSVAGTYNFGLRATSSNTTSSFTATDYATGTTHLIVISYEIVAGTTNDVMSMWIDPDLSGPEPAADLTQTGLATDLVDVTRFFLRQGTNAVNAELDGIRVATSWNYAPLPVEMTSFVTTANHLTASLRWSTATEVNNFGFEIERKSATASWSKVGFVTGAGTSTSLHTYTFSDNLEQAGLYEYRIKQIDKSGSFKYSKTAQVEAGLAPKELSLGANYPNPFNPSTNIEFTVPSDGRVVLKVYNIVGQEVATLFNGNAVAGQINKASFNASRLPSGVYFSRMEFGGNVLVKRMMLLK